MSETEAWAWRIAGFMLGVLIWRFFRNIDRIATAIEQHATQETPNDND